MIGTAFNAASTELGISLGSLDVWRWSLGKIGVT
jgi:hypothetical protein